MVRAVFAMLPFADRVFAGRIVDIDAHGAEQAGRLSASAASQAANTDPIDALIASCANARGAAVATRTVGDFAPLGVTVIDPWTSSARARCPMRQTGEHVVKLRTEGNIVGNCHSEYPPPRTMLERSLDSRCNPAVMNVWLRPVRGCGEDHARGTMERPEPHRANA